MKKAKIFIFVFLLFEIGETISQNIINWENITINSVPYTMQVDANISQLDNTHDLFYSGNRDHINSFYLLNSGGQRIDNSSLEYQAISTIESYFNLTQYLSWPDECNFQIDPLLLNYYTGVDNQNNLVNVYFPDAFDENYFNSHVWLGFGGYNGLANYNRRVECYVTLWKSCIMSEVTLFMNSEYLEKTIYEEYGSKIIEVFGENTNISRSDLITGLIQFRDALTLEAQISQSIMRWSNPFGQYFIQI